MTEREQRRSELASLFRDRSKRFADAESFVEREVSAAREQALEEAAVAVEGWSSNTTTWNNAVAKRIRALKAAKP